MKEIDQKILAEIARFNALLDVTDAMLKGIARDLTEVKRLFSQVTQ